MAAKVAGVTRIIAVDVLAERLAQPDPARLTLQPQDVT